MGNIITVSEPKRGLPFRILTPSEYRLLREKLKVQHRTILDAQLFTGMRQTEFDIFMKHPEFYQRDRKLIRLTPTAIKKVKTHFKDRSIFLSHLGVAAVERMLDYKPHVPNRAAWRETLRHAATAAEIDATGIAPKCLRKTWESWLVASFPQATLHVLSSQGHSITTSLNHYIGIGFGRAETDDIKQYTEGWLR